MAPTYGGSRSASAVAEDFSILRLIEAVRRDGNPTAGRYEAGLVQLQRERGGIEVQSRLGAPLPDRTLIRDLGTNIPTGGGGLVTAGVLGLVEAVRPVLALEQLGAQVIEAPAGRDFNLPIWQGALGPSSWIDEGAAAPVFSGLEVAATTFSAHGCAARLAFSRKLAASSGPAIEPAVIAELGRAVRSELERGFINGTGADGEPLGVLNADGLGSVAIAGATPTASELAEMVEAAGTADADLSRCSWLLNPADLAVLLRTQAASGSEMLVSWAGGSHRIQGFRAMASTNIPAGTYVFGDFSTVRIAYFGPPQLIIDTFSNGKSATGDTEIVLINYADIGLIEPAHIVLGTA